MKNAFLRNNLLCILFAVAVFSCSRKINDRLMVIDTAQSPDGKISFLGDIAENVEYIPLQTSKESLISYIYDIKTTNNKVYIKSLNEIICFYETGEFFSRLSSKGRGPGEYQSIYDFDINSDNDQIAILSSRKIHLYIVRGEKYLYSKSLNCIFQPGNIDFTPGRNNIFLTYSSYGNEPFRNLLINSEGDTLNSRPNFFKFTKIGGLNLAMPDENIIYTYNGEIHFKEMFCDTVFSLDKDNNIKPHFVLDSHGKRPTAKARAETEFFITQLPKYIRVVKIFEVSRYLIYKFHYERAQSYSISDKVLNKRFEVNSGTLFKDDISGGIDFEPKFCSDEKLYSWVEALKLKNYVSSPSFENSVVRNPEKKLALKNLADSLKETDNPVLIVVTPKK